MFGDLADDERFVAAYASALASLHLRGARATLESLADRRRRRQLRGRLRDRKLPAAAAASTARAAE